MRMPRQQCTVCKHPDLGAIEAALVSGASVRECAGRFGLSKTAVDRHRNHGKNQKTLINIGQIAKIDKEIAKLHRAENRAKRKRDNAACLAIARELRNWFTLRAKAEAISGAQAQQTQELSRTEALAIAMALVESEIASGSPEILDWLQTVSERAAHVNKSEVGTDSDVGATPALSAGVEDAG